MDTDADMTFSKNRGHGHGADKLRTRVSTDLWLTVEFDRFSLAQTLKAIFTKIHLGYEIKSIDNWCLVQLCEKSELNETGMTKVCR